jgi:3-oxoacyl-[acyl-carrier protein] reductase
VAGLLGGAGAEVLAGPAGPGDPDATASGARLGAVVLDASALASAGELEPVRAALAPALRRLGPSGRLVVIGAPVAEGGAVVGGAAQGGADLQRAAVQQALEGLTRSLGKEVRAGATANLVRVDPHDPAALDAAASTLLFLLSARSAFVSGQVVAVAAPATGAVPAPAPSPLDGRVAVVTGAARGIGAAIAEVLAARGAHVVAVDVPAAGRRSPGSPTPSAAPRCSWTSPPRTPRRAWSPTCASATAGRTSWSTTRASPATGCSSTSTPSSGGRWWRSTSPPRCA